ncbi:restriction endonuclease subunit S [Xanthomonas arboricola]|uniref:restriction endonuclease subunit S n=1 Tax=Xanthomonas arboricola TaxID=56448 RepID=UPI001612A2BF|nr:restriction endonuclease subunit S [Xanthomonas arboricola]MBB3797584.1 type I restriction enzyme S subunit [Xanthomonas arboricola]MCC8670933.1 restriction endonuclease subunit S [Xanthomonas arboricola]
MNENNEETWGDHPYAGSKLPQGWEIVTISQIAESVVPGFASGIYNSDGNGTPHLRPMNISRAGKIDLAVLKSVPQSNGIEVLDGDVLFNNTNSTELVGKTALVSKREEGFAFSNHMTRIRVEDGVNAQFVAMQLHFLWMQGYIRQHCKNHVNQSSISTKTLANVVRLCLPPKDQQGRIVTALMELLSNLDAAVTELENARSTLSTYRESLLKAAVEGGLSEEFRRGRSTLLDAGAALERVMHRRRAAWEREQLHKHSLSSKLMPDNWTTNYSEFASPNTSMLSSLPAGWVWATVEQVASKERHSLAIGPFGSNLKVTDYRDSGVPLVFVRNIRSGNYGKSHTRYVTKEKAASLSAHSVVGGDVLVTKMGEPPGDADLYPLAEPMAIITADCIKIRCESELVNPIFLKAVINSQLGKTQIESMTQGVAQKKVSLSRFKGLKIPLPPLEEQIEIVRLLEDAEKKAAAQQAAITESLAQSALQRSNIMLRAFSGQLLEETSNPNSASDLLSTITARRAVRASLSLPAVRKKKSKGATPMKSSAISVLRAARDWLSAQQLFALCGVTDGASTDEIEALYAELRELDQASMLIVEPVTDEQGLKLYDRLKILEE